MGEEGPAGLGEAGRAALAGAELVFGGARHLALAAPLITGRAEPWPKPFDASMAAVRAAAGRRVCVLASGDPFCHGVGATLARHVPPGEMRVLPAPSAFSLAAARLGWALEHVDTLSLHGRPPSLLRPLLHPGRRLLVLTADGAAPAAIAALMTGAGFGPSRVIVLEALGGRAEARHESRAEALGTRGFNPLNLLAIEVEAAPGARVLPLTPGLPEDAFEHDGQITKREIRALTLAALAPRRGERLWDIGGGSGSVSIEWMLAHPSLSAIAIEARADRASRIGRNAEALGVPGLVVVQGRAPDALAGLAAPDAVFIGGGGSAPGVLGAAIGALRAGGRLVANAVSLEFEALLLAEQGARGGALRRIGLERAEALGPMRGWRPAMSVTQWVWEKP